MNNTLYTFLYIILGICIILTELFRRKDTKIDLLTVINIGYSIVFIIIPILILNLDLSSHMHKEILSNLNINDEKYILYALVLISIAYISTTVGFYFKDISCIILNKRCLRKYKNLRFNINSKNIDIVAMSTFIVATLSLAIYTMKLGGISSTLKSAELYRMYGAEQISGSFIKVFFPLIIASCNLYYILMLENKLKLIYKSMFVITFSISIYYLLINAGRFPMFIFLATFIVFKILKDNKIGYIIPTAIGGIFLMQYLDNLFGYLAFGESFSGIATNENKTLLTIIKNFVVEFSFPYINVLNIAEFTEGVFRFFSDYTMSVIQFLPDTIFFKLGFGSPVMLHEVNTLNHLSSSGIPVDIVSYGYYQIGILGIIIHTFLFGLITRYLNNLSNRKGSYIYIFLKSKLMLIWGFNIMYSDIDTFIRGKLDLIAIVFLIIMLSKIESENLSSV